MGYATPINELDKKVKQILQEAVDKHAFEIYERYQNQQKECHLIARNVDNTAIDKLNEGLSPNEITKLLNFDASEEKYKSYQISSALGNMILFQLRRDGALAKPVILF